MHNKIHSVISPLFRIKNADTETGWNVQILRSVWIISAEIRYLLSGQKKFQNKSKNIDEVYQSVFFRCIMFLSYRVTFLCNVLGQIHYTSESPVRYFFYEKVVKWWFLIQRIYRKELLSSEDRELSLLMQRKYPREYQCSLKVAEYIMQATGSRLSEEEIMYLSVHIRRVSTIDL